MAHRRGVALAAYAPRGSPAGPLVEAALGAARAGLRARVARLETARDLRAYLGREQEAVLFLPEPRPELHLALGAGGLVTTCAAHRDALPGRDLVLLDDRSEATVVRELLGVLRAVPRLGGLRRGARRLAAGFASPEAFAARFASPEVSVVMPAYQAGASVQESARSVLTQHLAALELIVVDDASTDATRARLLELDDPRLTLAWGRGGGPSAARNLGLSLARGELLAFLDADDRWDPRCLQRLTARLRAAPPEVGLVYCNSRLSLDGEPAGELAPEDASFPALAQSDGLIPTGAFVVRRELAEAVGPLDEELFRGEDYEWLLRLAARARFAHEPALLHEYRRTSQGQLAGTRPDTLRLDRARGREIRAWKLRELGA